MRNPLTHIVLLPLTYFSLLFLTLQVSKGVVGREEKRREEKRTDQITLLKFHFPANYSLLKTILLPDKKPDIMDKNKTII